jgi:hypothetical protein
MENSDNQQKKMKTQSNFKEFARQNQTELVDLVLLGGLLAFALPNVFPSGITDLNHRRSPNVLEYLSPNGEKMRITEKGYSVFNDTTGKYRDFVSFDNDSALYWKFKEYDDMMNQANAEKAKQSGLEEGLK